MKARFEQIPGARVELVKSSGGVFEIEKDGVAVFSKKALNRFPTEQEVEAMAAG